MNASKSGQLIDYKHILGKDYQKCCLWDAREQLSLHYGKEHAYQQLAISYGIPKKGAESPRENEGKDEVFDAINQVLKSITYKAAIEIEVDRQIPPQPLGWTFVYVYYPVIVFDGLLCRGILSEGKIKLAEANHVVLKTQFKPHYARRQQDFYIDIVTKSYFEKYLEMVEKECKELVDLAEQNAPSFYTDASAQFGQRREQRSIKGSSSFKGG